MVPLARSSRKEERDGLMISDSWYVGAFGRWWRGGIIEAWYQDVITRSKDEESWSSGILSMKNLDMLNEYSGKHIYYFDDIPAA
jgi:epidermal growth factor receptor substrate 15